MLKLLAIALPTCAGLAHAQTQTVFDIRNTVPIAEVRVTLNSAKWSHVIELRNMSVKGGAIIQLLDSGGSELTSTVNKATPDALSVDGKVAGTFTVIVRSAPEKPLSIETADLWVDGKLHTPNPA